MDEAAGRVEREARREQAAAEAEAHQLHLASRTLTDVAWEAMQQGHRIRLAWPGGDLTGIALAAVGDLVVVRTEIGAAAANVGVLFSVEVVERSVDRGSAGDRTVESFVAWCRMVEGRQVRAAMVGGRDVEGTLVATASDHLLVRSRSGDETALARSQLAAISVAGDPFLPL
jgi:hypothetical protein